MSTNEEIFSERLREVMRIRNVTAAELARAMRTTSSTVFGWLKGTRPRPRAFEDLSQTLGVPLTYLKGESDYEFENEIDPIDILSHSAAEVALRRQRDGGPWQPFDHDAIGLWESKLRDVAQMGHENAWMMVERSLGRMEEAPETAAKELPMLRLLLLYLKTSTPDTK